jgi:hypothetical protein
MGVLMVLPILLGLVVLAVLLMMFAMARVSARADRVAQDQRAQLEGEVGAADHRRAAG